jgi:hypothetical protein
MRLNFIVGSDINCHYIKEALHTLRFTSLALMETVMKPRLSLVLFSKFLILIFTAQFLTGCVPAIIAVTKGAMAASKVPDSDPEKTQLQIREIQTRTYDTHDAKAVLKTMLNVLQDDGFIVTEANSELGLLSAYKDVDVQTKGAAFWGTVFETAWDKNATVEATANVSEFGNQTRVRVNFQQKVHDSYGGVAKVEQIDELEFYQQFFIKVDKGLFIQQEKL